MKRSFFGIRCLTLLFSAALVHGQGFTGPGSRNNDRQDNRRVQAVTVSQPVTVSEAGNLPDDSWVILRGNIAGALPGGKYYTFRDPSGEITVEIDWRVWRGLSAGPSDLVDISGGLEIKRDRTLIEVRTITRAGTVIQPVTVSEARRLPNKSWVILTGNIVNALRDEYYTFRDSTGEITVDIERKVWRGLSVGVSDRVEISGELEIKRGQTSIEVKAVRKI
jgi:uncharacterized protein (TIGR00156 family)